MKKPDLTLVLLSATLFLGTGAAVSAQTASPTPPPGDDAAPPPPARAEWVKKFDKNGDGKLDAAERAEAREEFARNHPRLAQRMKSGKRGPGVDAFRRGYMLGKFDQNGDGKLDEMERAAARAEGEKRLRAHMEKQLQHLKAIDTDGDGKISDAEWAASKAQREKMRAEHRGPGQRGEHGPGPQAGPPPPPEGEAAAGFEPQA